MQISERRGNSRTKDLVDTGVYLTFTVSESIEARMAKVEYER